MKVFYLLLLSFGIVSYSFAQVQTNSVKKASRIVKSEDFRSLSDDSGYYLFPHFGMRYGPYIKDQYSGIQDLSLYYGLGFGFRRQNLSLESGLSFFHHDSSPYYVEVTGDFLGISGSGSPNLVLPFTFRYDIPTGARGNIRVGAFLNSNVSVFGFESDVKNRSGQILTREGELVDYTLDLVRKSPFFFKTGIHSRIRVFNSAFLNFELGQFFTLGPNRIYELRIENNPPIRLSRSWEGFSWTFGGILPLTVFEEKLRKKE
ncbi:hypothetical protein DFQ04_3144 [Algoriphagus boseongensis]|uniref:Outer membrane protein with beta-barrel domain n=1 Tax=Algoriphagus boseongensis TaxID=1442587 RepID=A0A4R6T6C3_9BACT|nr:hypothetical protein [Algoriphagus boseongensis]TDQ15257.1 hypothetical protein DFQ04_3144 [Algoriphagus boseongensis]